MTKSEADCVGEFSFSLKPSKPYPLYTALDAKTNELDDNSTIWCFFLASDRENLQIY